MDYPFSPSYTVYYIVFSMFYLCAILSPVSLLFYFNKNLRALLLNSPPSYSERNDIVTIKTVQSLYLAGSEDDFTNPSGYDLQDHNELSMHPLTDEEAKELFAVSRLTLSYFRRKYPYADVAMESVLAAELSMSEMQIERSIRTLLSSAGREYQKDAIRNLPITVEDIVLLVASATQMQSRLTKMPSRRRNRYFRAA